MEWFSDVSEHLIDDMRERPNLYLIISGVWLGWIALIMTALVLTILYMKRRKAKEEKTLEHSYAKLVARVNEQCPV